MAVVCRFERDSVCAADDMDAPNTYRFQLAEEARLTEVLKSSRVANYLPCVYQSKTFWSAWIEGTMVAKIEHHCFGGGRAKITFCVPDGVINTDRVFFRADGQKRNVLQRLFSKMLFH